MNTKQKDIELPKNALGARELTLEITSGCNLSCIHCYDNFGPGMGELDKVELEDWQRVLRESNDLGTTNIQISGGEPTISPYLVELVKYAHELQFPKVKIYTNAIHISEEMLDAFKGTDTLVRVTFFSHNPEHHDRVTRVKGSHTKASANIVRMYEKGIRLRAGISLTPENSESGELEDTIKYLNKLGISDVVEEPIHGNGRARSFLIEEGYDRLCGECWMGKIAIDSQGYAHPCATNRHIVLGNILEQSLGEIVAKPELQEFRKDIYRVFEMNE
jgi:MoaA/NifB/PqqE/SkfB family radical SAM enzyme